MCTGIGRLLRVFASPQGGKATVHTVHRLRRLLTGFYPQRARVATLQAAYRKKETQDPRTDAPTAGEIRQLGLLKGSLEEKHIKPSKWLPHVKDNVS